MDSALRRRTMRYIARLSVPMLPTSTLHQVSRLLPPILVFARTIIGLLRKRSILFSGLPQKRRSMVLQNQQTDALNLVKLFYEKAPFLRGTSSYKRGLHPIISPENKKRGVQITSNASQAALTSMLETVKNGV